MARRTSSRKAARSAKRNRNPRKANSNFGRLLYGRRLRLEPLEDRRLLALITVTTLEDSVNLDDGVTSLREAIFAANTVEGADTIEFAPELFAIAPGRILLSQGELKISDSVTIMGPGSEFLTLDASGSDPTPELRNGDGSRSIYVSNDNPNIAIDVKIAGVAIVGGDVLTQGGGIRVRHDNLTIEDVIVLNNHGGGVFHERDHLTIRDCLIEGNYSSGVGGLWASDATLYVSSTTFRGNAATEGSGGGVFYDAFSFSHEPPVGIEIRDSSFIENSSDSFGGGARVGGNGDVVVENNLFERNGAASGGGIYVDSSTANILGNQFSANSADLRGGGALLFGGEYLFDGNELFGNSAQSEGGGLYLSTNNTSTIRDSVVRGNVAGVSGGGIYIASHVSLPYRVFTIQSTTIEDNVATFEGGGLASFEPTVIRQSYFSGNSTEEGDGGAILSEHDLTVEASQFLENKALGESSSGGGIAAQSRKLSISHSQFSENFATSDGGGVWNPIQNGASTTTIDQSTFRGNIADRNGGALATTSRDWRATGSTFSGNRAGALGGGIWMLQGGRIEHSTVTSNDAVLGTGVFVQSELLTLDHTIVARNESPLLPELTGVIGTSIVAHHSLIGSNSGTAFAMTPAGSTDANGNLIGGSTFATRLNPRLSPLADNGGFTLPDGSRILTHALLLGSPAINAGDLNVVAGEEGVPAFDQRGEPFTRVFGGRIDMGAVETIPAGFLPGDYSLDGVVDAMDYALWRNSTGTFVAPGSGADGNGDGRVDHADYLVWKRNFGATLGEHGALFGNAQGLGSAEQGAGSMEFNDGSTANGRSAIDFGSLISEERQKGVGESSTSKRTPERVDSPRRTQVLEVWLATRDRQRRGNADEQVVTRPIDSESVDCALAEITEMRLAFCQ